MNVRAALQSKGNKIGQTKSSVLNANEKKNLSKSRMYVCIEKEVEKKNYKNIQSFCKLKLCMYVCFFFFCVWEWWPRHLLVNLRK